MLKYNPVTWSTFAFKGTSFLLHFYFDSHEGDILGSGELFTGTHPLYNFFIPATRKGLKLFAFYISAQTQT